MREEIQRIADAFLTPLQASLAGVEATMMPLLDALMVFVIAAAALSAAFRRNDMLGATWHCIFILGITQAALRYWPQLLEWSIGTAGDLTELGGAGQITDPFEIASAGAAGLAAVLLFIAWRVNSMISGILLGRPGWSGAGMLTGAIAAAGGLVVSGLAGGSGAAAASQAGGGGGRSNPGTGSGSNPISTTRQPVNSRSAAS